MKKAPKAQRSRCGHLNAADSLLVFAPSAPAAATTERQDAGVALAAPFYFWARAGPYLVSIAGRPIVPCTPCVLVDVGAQLWLAVRLA
ncbi:hypothetical protein ACS5PK_10985 [Roseateles sp. DB2]|uniref:hypothetical protein n=1 Tax=Roseateles sp. DB2 TaxID=3453717 RepID=UPI003EED2EEE